MQTDLAQLEIMIGGNTGLRGGIDIFAGPPRPIGGRVGETTDQSQSGGDVGGERGAPRKGTYTMFDEEGDPGESESKKWDSPPVFFTFLFEMKP